MAPNLPFDDSFYAIDGFQEQLLAGGRPAFDGNHWPAWVGFNCHHCEKRFDQTTHQHRCELEFNLDFGTVCCGLIPEQIAARLGWTVESGIAPRCPEFAREGQIAISPIDPRQKQLFVI